MVPVPCPYMVPVPPPAYQNAVVTGGPALHTWRAHPGDAPAPAHAVPLGRAAGGAALPATLGRWARGHPTPLQRRVAAADRPAAHALASLAPRHDGLAACLAGGLGSAGCPHAGMIQRAREAGDQSAPNATPDSAEEFMPLLAELNR